MFITWVNVFERCSVKFGTYFDSGDFIVYRENLANLRDLELIMSQLIDSFFLVFCQGSAMDVNGHL